MQSRPFILFAVILSMLVAAPGVSLALTHSDIDFWFGEGEKEIGFVIDFNDGAETDSYAWGYRYDSEDVGTGPFAKENFVSDITLALMAADERVQGAYYLWGGQRRHPGFLSSEYQDQYQDGDFLDPEKVMSGMWWPMATDAAELTGEEIWHYPTYNSTIPMEDLDRPDLVSFTGIFPNIFGPDLRTFPE